MKFSRKMRLKIKVAKKVAKNQGLTFTSEDPFLEEPQGAVKLTTQPFLG